MSRDATYGYGFYEGTRDALVILALLLVAVGAGLSAGALVDSFHPSTHCPSPKAVTVVAK